MDDLIPLIHEFAGNKYPARQICHAWRHAVIELDEYLIANLRKKYTVYQVKGISIPISCVQDIAIQAITIDDIDTVKNLMFIYSLHDRIDWYRASTAGYHPEIYDLYTLYGADYGFGMPYLETICDESIEEDDPDAFERYIAIEPLEDQDHKEYIMLFVMECDAINIWRRFLNNEIEYIRKHILGDVRGKILDFYLQNHASVILGDMILLLTQNKSTPQILDIIDLILSKYRSQIPETQLDELFQSLRNNKEKYLLLKHQ